MLRVPRRRVPIALAVPAVVLGMAAAPAHATPMPLGDYPCSYYSGSTYYSAGTVNVVGAGQYRINSGADGAYSWDSATNIVTFATGDYSSFYGVWDPNRPDSVEIHDKTDGTYLWACNRSAGSEAQYPQGGAPGGEQPGGEQPPTDHGTAPPPAPATDTQAPDATLRFASATRMGTALSRGLAASATCDEACSVRSTATISSRDARRLGLARSSARSVTVARGSGRLEAAGSKRVTVRFTRAAKRRLRRARRVTLTVRTRIVDGAGNARTLSQRVRLRR